jgi:hypothetical protein
MRSRPKHPLAAEIAELKDQLTSVATTLTALADRVQEPPAESFTIRQFCARHSLSESAFHKLQREGRGPAVMSIGSVGKRIGREAERAWGAAREAEGEAVGRRTTALRKNGANNGSEKRSGPDAAGAGPDQMC